MSGSNHPGFAALRLVSQIHVNSKGDADSGAHWELDHAQIVGWTDMASHQKFDSQMKHFGLGPEVSVANVSAQDRRQRYTRRLV